MRNPSPRDVRHVLKMCASPPKHVIARAKPACDNEAAALAMLRAFLMKKFADGLPATDICELCTLIQNCGIQGLGDLAWDHILNPALKKNASRSVSRASGVDVIERNLYYAKIPIAGDAGREFAPIPFNLLQDIFVEELQYHGEDLLKSRNLQSKNWTENKLRLKAVAEGHIPLPYGVFVDGAPWKGKGTGTKDSIITYQVNVGLAVQRRTWFSIRKDFLCGVRSACPCRGACSLQAAERIMRWDAECAATGIYASRGYDGANFVNADRCHRAGKPLFRASGKLVVFILVELRNDWDQAASGLGFPRHNQRLFCWKCQCVKTDRYKFHDHNNWTCWNDAAYRAAIARCVIIITISEDEVVRVFGSLKFDFRKQGLHGRIIHTRHHLHVQDLDSNVMVPLQHGDKLMVWGSVKDIHNSAEQVCDAGPPFKIKFWRKHAAVPFTMEPELLHISGVKIEYVMQDDLHMLDLGVTPKLEGEVIVEVLKSGVLGNEFSEAGFDVGMQHLNRRLREWSNARERYCRTKGRKISTIKRLTLKSLSVSNLQSKGNLKAKGAEAKHLLPFVHKLLTQEVVDKLGLRGQNLKRATACLLMAYNLMRDSGRTIDHAELHDLFTKTARACKRAGVNMIPKFHFLCHFGKQACDHGNPRFHSAYADESKNRALVIVAQSCHTKDFSARALGKENLSLQLSREIAELIHECS